MRAPARLAKGAEVKAGKDRNMVRGLLPPAQLAQDTAAVGGVRYVGRGPDMVQPAALVGGVPVRAAIGPPAVKRPHGNVLPGHIDPAARGLRGPKMLHLHRRMADDLQQRLVVPDIILARGDVQIAHQNGAVGPVPAKEIAHLGQEIELLAKLLVFVPVGNIAARRHIDVVNGNAVLQPGRHMAGMAKACKILCTGLDDGQA